MQVLGIIPARYESTRFPGKPLINIHGKPMIQHVYEKVALKIKHVIVATDDERIYKSVQSFGGNVVLTSSEHTSGTSRCIEAFDIFRQENNNIHVDIIINIQGDEPTLKPNQLNELVECFEDEKTDIATLIRSINNKEDIFNPNVVKVVFNENNHAMYFSRFPIPYIRDKQKEEWFDSYNFSKHIGIYAFRSHILPKLKHLPTSKIEKAESLEQLNWLYNGYTITVRETEYENIGIDTPEDLENLLKKWIV